MTLTMFCVSALDMCNILGNCCGNQIEMFSETYQHVCFCVVHEKIPHIRNCDSFLQANMSMCDAQLTMTVTHQPVKN